MVRATLPSIIQVIDVTEHTICFPGYCNRSTGAPRGGGAVRVRYCIIWDYSSAAGTSTVRQDVGRIMSWEKLYEHDASFLSQQFVNLFMSSIIYRL